MYGITTARIDYCMIFYIFLIACCCWAKASPLLFPWAPVYLIVFILFVLFICYYTYYNTILKIVVINLLYVLMPGTDQRIKLTTKHCNIIICRRSHTGFNCPEGWQQFRFQYPNLSFDKNSCQSIEIKIIRLLF